MQTAVIKSQATAISIENADKSDNADITVDGCPYLMSNEPMSSDHYPNPNTNPTNPNLTNPNPKNTQYY